MEKKNTETLKKQYDPSTIPPEISQWITHKFHFRSQSAIQKKSVKNMEPSFEVVMIKDMENKQHYQTSYTMNLMMICHHW